MIGKSSQIELLSGLMRQAERQHQVTSQNIANINTPGYHTMGITFSETLQELEQHGASAVQGHMAEVEGLKVRQDDNNVDLDRELGKLKKNAIRYETVSQLLISKLGMMRSAITGQ